MSLPENPFKSADRYVTLREKCTPGTFLGQVQRMNDMIVMPVIAIFLFFTGLDKMMIVSAGLTGFRVWNEWIEFTELQFMMQRMRLRMAQVGGPFIRTNDPKYMPYVWADAVVRHQPRL